MLTRPRQHGRCDVLVVGGGPAGSAAALTLRSHGLRVVLLEASGYENWRAGETLLPRVRDPLAALDLSALLDELGSLPSYGNRSAWGTDELASHSFFGGLGSHGYHVDRRRFDAALADSCEQAGVEVRRHARLRTLCALRDGSYAGVDAQGVRMFAAAVVDASGRSAHVAARLGGRRERLDKLIAVVGQFEVREPHCYTLVEASADGWWYSAPVPGRRLIVAQLTDAGVHTAAELRSGFIGRLEKTSHTRQRLESHARLPISLRVVAACSHRLRAPPGPRRWLAVGDAALCADPLSGTGVQRALECGRAGALALSRQLGGDALALERFDRSLDRDYARYLRQRLEFYAAETRFVDQAFWQRRSEPREPTLYPTGVVFALHAGA